MPPSAPPAAIAELIAATPDARVGLAVASLDGAIAFGTRTEETFTQASAIKIPVLWELHRAGNAGELSVNETLPVDPTTGVGECGVLEYFANGVSSIGLADLGVLMTVLSDNPATNMLITRVGMDAVNALIRSKGAEETHLRRLMMDLEARAAGRENTSTPADALALMRRLKVDETAGDAAAAATLRVLRLKKESPVTAALCVLDPSIRPATKPGMLDGIRTEWSLVEEAPTPYAMALMADGSDEPTLEPLLRRLATAIHTEMASN